jgi:D-glycero-D-manno-heptose 1,7-bisphosphate phosphatase
MTLLILDRDGVINQDSDAYIRSMEDWIPIPGSIEAIARLSRAGFEVAIATNQSGLHRGYFDLDELESIHARMCQLVEEMGGRIAGIFYCPHMPDAGCACRKPATGLLESIERELCTSALGALFIGDSLKDLQAAQAYGCQPVLVRTGKGEQTLATLHGACPGVDRPLDIPVYSDLAEASRAILDSGNG